MAEFVVAGACGEHLGAAETREQAAGDALCPPGLASLPPPTPAHGIVRLVFTPQNMLEDTPTAVFAE